MSAPTKVHHDRDGKPRCGRGAQYPVTADEAAVTCEMCLNLIAGVHGLGNRRSDVQPCGTPAAYQRHRRRHGVPVRCETCLQGERIRHLDNPNRVAYNALRRQRRAARKNAGQYGRAA